MLQRLFIFLLFLLILPDIYLYFRFIAKRFFHWSRLLYWLPSLLLTAGLLYLVYYGDRSLAVRNAQAVGWYSIIFFLFAAPKLIVAFFCLLGEPFHKWLHWPRSPFTAVGIVLSLACAYIIVYGSFFGRTRFEIKEVTYTSNRIPAAFNGYRIVQLSDIHIGSWKGNIQAIQQLVDMTNSLHPDLIVFTGDLVNHRANELDGFQDILSKLKAKDGVYSILGNHDYGPYFRWRNKQDQEANLEELKKRETYMGWKLLNNEHDLLIADEDTIALIGVENDGEPPFSQYADLPKAIEGTQDMFQILLSHNPTHWRREVLPLSNIDLTLSGHTHAMQLQIGHHSPSSFIYPEWGGMYYEGKRGLYVNVGIGYVGLPFRFGAWPEITLLTLRR